MCPTRWTVRYKTISEVLNNYLDIINIFIILVNKCIH